MQNLSTVGGVFSSNIAVDSLHSKCTASFVEPFSDYSEMKSTDAIKWMP